MPRLELTPHLEQLLASFLPDLVVYADSDPHSPEYDGLQMLFDAGLIDYCSPTSDFLQITQKGRKRLRHE